jgi:hypothetical protein
VRLGQRPQLGLVAPDQQRLGPDPRHAALLADREDRPDEVLVAAHPAGDAVHHDA